MAMKHFLIALGCRLNVMFIIVRPCALCVLRHTAVYLLSMLNAEVTLWQLMVHIVVVDSAQVLGSRTIVLALLLPWSSHSTESHVPGSHLQFGADLGVNCPAHARGPKKTSKMSTMGAASSLCK